MTNQEEAERLAGKESFILMIVANWKYHGDHFVKLNLKPLWPYCENDYKLVLHELQGSNFRSDPNNNSLRFHTIVSLNESKEELENRMLEFTEFWYQNKIKKISGLESLKKLEIFDVAVNEIKELQGLEA